MRHSQGQSRLGLQVKALHPSPNRLVGRKLEDRPAHRHRRSGLTGICLSPYRLRDPGVRRRERGEPRAGADLEQLDAAVEAIDFRFPDVPVAAVDLYGIVQDPVQ